MLIRINGVEDKKGHSHHRTYQSARLLLNIVLSGYMPTERYYVKAAHRILKDEELAKLRIKPRKPSYINHR